MCGSGLIRMGRMAPQETTAATPAVTGEHRVPCVPTADAA